MEVKEDFFNEWKGEVWEDHNCKFTQFHLGGENHHASCSDTRQVEAESKIWWGEGHGGGGRTNRTNPSFEFEEPTGCGPALSQVRDPNLEDSRAYWPTFYVRIYVQERSERGGVSCLLVNTYHFYDFYASSGYNYA
jgi:hypothetical protein